MRPINTTPVTNNKNDFPTSLCIGFSQRLSLRKISQDVNLGQPKKNRPTKNSIKNNIITEKAHTECTELKCVSLYINNEKDR